MTKRQDPWPRCEDESGCTSAVRRDPVTDKGPAVDLRCARHAIDDTLIRPEPEKVYIEEEELDSAEPEDVVDDSPESVERIASLRAALREGFLTADVADLIRDQILDALRASKRTFVPCGHCKHKVLVTLPDLGVRMNAASKLLEEIEGKLVTAAEAKLTAEQRQIESRQERLAKMLGVNLEVEIERLSNQLGVAANSPPDTTFEGFSTEDLVRFVERNGVGDGE